MRVGGVLALPLSLYPPPRTELAPTPYTPFPAKLARESYLYSPFLSDHDSPLRKELAFGWSIKLPTSYATFRAFRIAMVRRKSLIFQKICGKKSKLR